MPRLLEEAEKQGGVLRPLRARRSQSVNRSLRIGSSPLTPAAAPGLELRARVLTLRSGFTVKGIGQIPLRSRETTGVYVCACAHVPVGWLFCVCVEGEPGKGKSGKVLDIPGDNSVQM